MEVDEQSKRDELELRFLRYRLAVVGEWPESESKSARMTAIRFRLSGLGRGGRECISKSTDRY